MKIGSVAVRSRNIPILYAATMIGGMLFYIPILAVYFEHELFTATSVALVFAVEAFAGVVLEVPTGAIADLFGRRRTLIAAHLVLLCAVLLLQIGGNMAVLLGYAVLSAFARGLNSGTDEALLFDSLREDGQEHHFKQVIGVYHALWPLGATLGSIAGGYLAERSLHLTVSASFVPVLIALILTFFLKEPHYEREAHHNVLRHMATAFRVTISSRQLVILVTAGLVMMAAGESAHLLSPLFFAFKDIPIRYFGWISAFIYGFSSLGFYLSHGISEKVGNRRTLVIVSVLTPIFILGATVFGGLPMVALWTSASVFFGIKNPIISHLLNLEVDSSHRATVISMNNFMGQLGVAGAMPLFGYCAELYSIQVAVQIGAVVLLLVPAMLLLLREKA